MGRSRWRRGAHGDPGGDRVLTEHIVGRRLERLTVRSDEAPGKRTWGKCAQVIVLERGQESRIYPRGASEFLEGNASLLTQLTEHTTCRRHPAPCSLAYPRPAFTLLRRGGRLQRGDDHPGKRDPSRPRPPGRSAQVDGDHLRETGLLHGHAVQRVGGLHGLPVV